MKKIESINIFWFRRDLRLEDNHGLWQALSSGKLVLPIFIFDKNILDELPLNDGRVSFIYNTLSNLKSALRKEGSDLQTYYDNPEVAWQKIIKEYPVNKVFTNRDYEPYAKSRDEKIQKLLAHHNIEFETFKDHVIFENSEVRSLSDTTYTVFTPYKKKWLERFEEEFIKNPSWGFPSEKLLANTAKLALTKMPSLEDMGFQSSDLGIPPEDVPQSVIKNYDETRNFPALPQSTSRLGIHFRFGTISIRKKAVKCSKLSAVYLSELIWRDFYSQILDAFPHVVTDSFKPAYDNIPWRDNSKEFIAWCEGKTGYPIVDAGMRELNATGYMHNRVRMITASFLTKHLLQDWRKGEAYFAEKLLDYDLASNNGGWQWAAGSGTDAAPYFRIFNPTSQQQKFDKDEVYIKKWVPEYGTKNYPEPIVDHKFARERCLETYKAALNS